MRFYLSGYLGMGNGTAQDAFSILKVTFEDASGKALPELSESPVRGPAANELGYAGAAASPDGVTMAVK